MVHFLSATVVCFAAALDISPYIPLSVELTGVCMVFSGRGMAGDLQVGLGLGPGFGQQPHPAPEAAPEQQPPQPVDAVPDHADGPPRPVPRVAVPGRQRDSALGGVRRLPGAILRSLASSTPRSWPGAGSGPIGQGHQRRHRQHEPMPGDARRVGPAGFMPLPAQALDRPPVGAEGRL